MRKPKHDPFLDFLPPPPPPGPEWPKHARPKPARKPRPASFASFALPAPPSIHDHLAAMDADPDTACMANVVRQGADEAIHYTARLTPIRPWSPLNDAEWDAVHPFLKLQATTGRPIEDPRTRLDAIFHMATSGRPWRELPPEYGKPDTVARAHRRWAHGKLWAKLLFALRQPGCPPALRALEYWIARTARRAMRLMGVPVIDLCRRLHLYTALPLAPGLLPDPRLSETVRPLAEKTLRIAEQAIAAARSLPDIRRVDLSRLRACQTLLARLAGRTRWPRAMAPP